jgi:hypothetical protein
MSSSRSIKRKKDREAQKKAKKAADKVGQAISRMPTSCDECGTNFDKNDKQALDGWRIAVYDEGPVHLVCPDCVPEDVASKDE